MECKTCKTEHDGSYGSGAFCSRACANSRGPRTEETKEKIKASLRKYNELNPEAAKARNWSCNKSPESRERKKAIWKAKRDYENAHYMTLRYYIKEDIGHCQECGLDSWRGVKIPLEVHHVDGNRKNNALSNLQVLCPNCHALTDNYRGRKTKKHIG